MTDADADISALSAWLACESPTTHAPGVNVMMDLVAADVASLPISVERLPAETGSATA